MPIIGIGTDLIEVERIKAAATDRFLKKNFTIHENKLFEARVRGGRAQTIAANFAAKEALVKALGTGFAGIMPDEIETLRDEYGKPYINVYGDAKEKCDELGVKKIHVSLSHIKEHAMAFVVLE